jgi:hypothetical protein
VTFGTTHSVFVFARSAEMKHRGSLLAAAAAVAKITGRLLAIGLMLYTALLLLTFFLGIFLWGRTVKAESAAVVADFRHYSPLASPQTMSPSRPDRNPARTRGESSNETERPDVPDQQ